MKNALERSSSNSTISEDSDLPGLKRTQIKLKQYPQFGRNIKRKPIENLNDYLFAEKKIFPKRYNEKNTAAFQVKDKDFEYIRLLGTGAFGTVSMVKKKDTEIFYARKEMAKHQIVISDKIQDVRNEKKILQSIRFPFTINLKFYYQDNVHIHLVLPLIAGGELYYHLGKHGKFNEGIVKFLTAQIVLAIEYLHNLGIVHRDLKLENILLDHFGYVKLIDFGMCKIIGYKRTYTMCGTAEYMAPEIVQNRGYGLPVDWWSLGVIIFELTAGKTPYVANDIIDIFYAIAKNKYQFPLHFSYQLSNLINNLLQTDLTKRYGNLKGGVNDIKTHEWFKNIHWLHLLNRRILSPIIHFVTNPDDDTFFAKDDSPPVISEKVNIYGKLFEDF